MANKPVLVKKIAKLGKRELTWTVLNGEEKYDIREWKNDQPQDGVRFTEEELREVCSQIEANKLDKIGNKSLVLINDEYSLSLVNNGRVYTRAFATKEEIEMLCKVCKESKKVIDWKPTEEKVEKKKETAKKEEPKKKDNVIPFTPRKPKPDLEEKLVTKGNATYEMCCEKLDKEMEIYTDSDSQYVLVGLKELCKVDSDFCNNVMREDKNFLGVMEYMMDMCQKGYGDKIGKGYSLDRDTGLGMAIDYYNKKPEPKPEPKKVEPKTKSKGRKKKEA